MKIFTSAIVFISILFFSTFSSVAQSYLWAYTGNYHNYTHLIAMKKDHAGYFYMATFTDSIGTTLKTQLDKRDSSQSVVWSKEFTGDVMICDVEINSLNHSIVTGYFQDSVTFGAFTLVSPFHHSSFVFEAEENGNITWAVTFNPDSEEFRPVDLFVDKNDQIYLTAEHSLNGFCSFHKLDVWGTPMLSEFPGNNNEVRTFSHIIADDSGNVYLSGTCGNFTMFDSIPVTLPASYQNMLVKYDANFNAQWVITREYITFDHNNSLCSDGHSLYWAFNEATTNSDSVRLIKTDYNGQLINSAAGPMGHSFFPAIAFNLDTAGKGLLVVNVFSRLYLFRYDDQFNLLWSDSIYSHTSGFPSEFQISCEDSSFYISSKYWGDTLYFGSYALLNPNTGTSDYDIFLAKWGFGSPVAVLSISSENLISYFPNPANEKLNLHYSGSNSATINILDRLGKICFRKNISANAYYEIDLTNLCSGLYFMRVENSTGSSYFDKIVVQH